MLDPEVAVETVSLGIASDWLQAGDCGCISNYKDYTIMVQTKQGGKRIG
jgi:hypothetical protein